MPELGPSIEEEEDESVIGVIYKTAGTRSFEAALSRDDVERGDWVMVDHAQAGPVLGQIAEVEEVSSLSYDQAQSIRLGAKVKFSKKLSGFVDVIGFRDNDGLVQTPRTPFSPGTKIYEAEDGFIQEVLGLMKDKDTGAYVGLLEGHDLKVLLDMNTLVQPAVVIDPHGEYTSLIFPNDDPEEQPRMKRFGIKPRGYSKHIMEYSVNVQDNPTALQVKLDGLGLGPDDIFDLSGIKPSGVQAGLVYRAIDGLKRLGKEYYSIDDIIFALEREGKNPIKWNVINSLEHIKTLGIFAEDKPTKMNTLVRPGMVSLINLRGASEDVVHVFVTQFMKRLFQARKANRVLPLMLFVEEAHNFCPQMSQTLSNKVMRTVASEGRKFGLGLCVVTQRPAKVDKNVLSQCNTQIIFKVTNPNDLKAISASMEGMTTSMQDDIQRLPVSHAIVVGGWITRPITVTVRIRESKHGGKGTDVFKEDTYYDEDIV